MVSSRVKRLFSIFPAAAVIAAAVVLSPAAAHAQQPEKKTTRVVIRNGQDLVRVVRALIVAGHYDDARQIISGYKPEDATYSYRVRYVEGLIAAASGDYKGAISIYRGILAERPDFTFVRYDLTQALYKAKDDDAAKYNAKMLIASGVDDITGGQLKSIVGNIDRRRPVRFTGYVSLAPSTNINGGTNADIVYINGLPFVIGTGSKQKSGLGYVAGGSMLFRRDLLENLAIVGDVSARGTWYPTAKTTSVMLSGKVGLSRDFDRGNLTVSAVSEQGFTNSDHVYSGYGGLIEASRYIGEKGRAYASFSLMQRDYPSSPKRDGMHAEFNGLYDRFFAPSRFGRILFGAVRETAELESLSFSEISGGLGYYAELQMGLTVYAQGSYALRNYDGPMPIFGTRKDKRLQLLATFTKRDFSMFGLAPQVSYSFTQNKSTSPFDSYKNHAVEVKLTRDF